jgi:DNA polymerase-1
VIDIAYIDGDIVAYESAAAAQQSFDFGGESPAHAYDEGRALDNAAARMETILEACGRPATVVVAFSCLSRRYFRHDLWPTYKSHRVAPKPFALPAVVAWFEANFKIIRMPGLEADDVLGILATKPKGMKKCVVVSRDKDMLQIPGQHLNCGKIEQGIKTVTRAEADRWHLYQTLVGDSTDGYPGCPRIGPVKAERLLSAPPAERWAAVVSAFINAGKTEEDALIQARVSRILRWSDWNSLKKEPVLWKPPSKV